MLIINNKGEYYVRRWRIRFFWCCRSNYCSRFSFMRFMIKPYITLNNNQKKYLLFYYILMFATTILAYCLNSYLIKPNINEFDSSINFFMHNYFNDIWAGIFIASLSNFLAIRKNKCFNNFWFYFILWILESTTWEMLRPFVLMFFNPFNKTPKFL